MEKTIELQEEFESLVNELKSFNKITSTNVENAEKTINEIQDFIQALLSFKEKVKRDYKTTKEELNNASSSLNNFLDSLASLKNDNEKYVLDLSENIISNFDEQSVEISKKFENLDKNSISNQKELMSKTIETIEYLNENTNLHANKLTALLKTISEKSLKSITLQNEKLKDKINIYTESLASVKEVNKSILVSFSTKLAADFDNQRITILDKLNQFDNAIISAQESIALSHIKFEKEVSANISNLLDEKFKVMHTQLNEIKEETKFIKTIAIIGFVIIISLLSALFF